MLVRFGCIACLLLAHPAASQTPSLGTRPDAQANQPQTPPPGATEIRTNAPLVLLDVVVQDAKGKPVLGLPRNAFQVTEHKAPQTVTAFEEHSTAHAPAAGPELPKMPAGTFTDYTPVPASGALNVLLVDALNTPMQDQSYLRLQLQQYVKKAAPGTRIAIFGLNTRLYFLQGFTSDLATLRDAVDHKLLPRASNLMDDAVNGEADSSMSDAAADAGLTDIASNLVQFEAMQQAYQLQLRTQYTLAAFNTLAHYLAAFPGRKNLIWFSGSFPIDILPDPSLNNPFAVMETNDEQFRETTNLLTRAQVAVYPVDARGLMTMPIFQASTAGQTYARNPAAMSNAVSKFNAGLASDHTTMEQMASDTGGRAYYNTNGLADAVTNAIDAGSNFYSLAYAPTDREPHGEYREIRVALSNDYAAAGAKLYYRHGYYADDPKHPAHAAASATSTAAQAALTNTASPSYAHAVMSRGAPAPEDILFKVRVLPVSTTPDTTLLKGDTPDPANPFKGPYRRYSIDYAALGSNLRLTLAASGKYTGAVEFNTFVYDSDGKLLNGVGKTVQLNLSPANAKQLVQSGFGMHLEVSAPAKSESFLRIAVHDLPSNRFGVVEVSTASVRRLPPAPAAPAAAPGPAPSGTAAPGSASAPTTPPASGPTLPPASPK